MCGFVENLQCPAKAPSFLWGGESFSLSVLLFPENCDIINVYIAAKGTKYYGDLTTPVTIKATPRRAGGADAQSDFSSDCIEIPQAY